MITYFGIVLFITFIFELSDAARIRALEKEVERLKNRPLYQITEDAKVSVLERKISDLELIVADLDARSWN